MYTDRVNILHAADGDRGIIGVTHDLKFDLFISFNALFDQNLMDR